MYTDAEERIYSIAIGVAGDLFDGDILGTGWRENIEDAKTEAFSITLGVCDDDPELSRFEALAISEIAADAIEDYLRNNPS